MFTQAELKEVLHYNPLTGVFTWLVKIGRARVGAVAGSYSKGYVQIKVGGKVRKAHRLAFFYMTGKWPVNKVDHEDLDKANNIWANLREATHQQNQCNKSIYANNTSGFKGIDWRKDKQKWRAAIQVRGETKFLGHFDTPEEAHAAYCSAAVVHHGQFARVT